MRLRGPSIQPWEHISTAGLYTAPASVTTTQNVTVNATSAADPTKSASAALTVVPAMTITTATHSQRYRRRAVQRNAGRELAQYRLTPGLSHREQ